MARISCGLAKHRGFTVTTSSKSNYPGSYSCVAFTQPGNRAPRSATNVNPTWIQPILYSCPNCFKKNCRALQLSFRCANLLAASLSVNIGSKIPTLPPILSSFGPRQVWINARVCWRKKLGVSYSLKIFVFKSETNFNETQAHLGRLISAEN